MRKGFFLIGIWFFLATPGWAQSAEARWRKAEKAFEKAQFAEARMHYETLLPERPDDATLHHRLADCYLATSPKKRALAHAFRSVELTEEPSQAQQFTLARALHLHHRFDEAIAAYEKSDPANRNRRAISEYVQQCQHGKTYVANPQPYRITGAGDQINTPHPEYLPHITADRQWLFFTSRRPGGKQDQDGRYYENIYAAPAKGGAWDTPQRLGPPLNAGDQHDACIGLSADGQTMFVYRGSNGGDIYISELRNGRWGKPEPFVHNSPAFESSATLSPDGRRLLFVSDRAGTKKIYACSRNVGGAWSKPRPLGPNVNSDKDQEAPFLHADGKTLYFSSKGHASMGGYDIFRIDFENDRAVGQPENLGYPINTADDDLYFVLAADGQLGYYATVREDGAGQHDIYTVRMPVKTQPRLALLKGSVRDEATGQPVEAVISITDNVADELVAQFRSRAEDGQYLIALPSGRNYGIVIEREGHLFHSENVFLAERDGYREVRREVELVTIRPGATIRLNNVFFDVAQFALRPESKAELQRLVKLMEQHPTMEVEIGGHTDSTGNQQANQLLAERRAGAVRDYLVGQGIGQARLQAIGYGSQQPVADNRTPEGRQRNRRTEFKVIRP